MTPHVFRTNVGSSPQPNRTYTGPAVPIAYDSNWQLFTNLTSDQIAWFQAQPEWQQFLDWVALSPAEATINADVTQTAMASALAVAKVSL